jgi:hypothetical protein
MWNFIGNTIRTGSNPSSNESTNHSQSEAGNTINESTNHSRSEAMDTDKIIELRSHLVTLLHLTGSKIVPKWQIDQTSIPALIEEMHAHLLPIAAFLNEIWHLEKEDFGKENELVKMMMQNAKEKLCPLPYTRTPAPALSPARALFSDDQYNDSESSALVSGPVEEVDTSSDSYYRSDESVNFRSPSPEATTAGEDEDFSEPLLTTTNAEDVGLDATAVSSNEIVERHRQDTIVDNTECAANVEYEAMMKHFLDGQYQLLSDLEQRFGATSTFPIAVVTDLNEALQHIVNTIFATSGGKLQLQMLPEAEKHFNLLSLSISKHHVEYAKHLQNKATNEEHSCVNITATTTREGLFRALDSTNDAVENTEVDDSPVFVAAIAAIRECLGQDQGTRVTDGKQRYFMTTGQQFQNILFNVNQLCLMYDIVDALMMKDILYDDNMAIARELSRLLGLPFDEDDKVIDYIVRVLHPGLSSMEQQTLKLAGKVMCQIMRSLAMVRVKALVRQKVMNAYKNSAVKTITGEEMITDDTNGGTYFAEGQSSAKARKRAVVLFFYYVGYHALKTKLDALFGQQHLNYNILCLAPDNVRTAFLDDFFSIESSGIPEERVKVIKAIIGPVANPVSSLKKRPLIFDSMEEFTALKELISLIERTMNSS